MDHNQLEVLVGKTAHAWCHHTGARWAEDTYQQAWVGALEELPRFRPGNAQVGPWLVQRIFWRLNDWARSTGPLNRKDAKENRQARQAGQTPPHHSGVIHLDAHEGLHERVAGSDPGTFDGVVDRIFVEQLLASADLNDRQRDVLHRYFFAGQTMSAIGADLGVTESRVSQIVTAALSLLRKEAVLA